MRKDLWLFLAKLLLFSLLFGYLWFSRFERTYPFFIEPVANWFFGLVGVRQWPLYLVLHHFTNLVPYAALVLSTPGVVRNWKRTLIALLGGLAIIIAVHILLSAALYFIVEEYGQSRSAYKFIVPLYLVNDALPLVLWLAFFPRVLSEMFWFVRLGGRDREERDGSSD